MRLDPTKMKDWQIAEAAEENLKPAAALAQVSFTATAVGKLSAKVTLAGKTYSFSETGYAAVEYGNDTAEELEEETPPPRRLSKRDGKALEVPPVATCPLTSREANSRMHWL